MVSTHVSTELDKRFSSADALATPWEVALTVLSEAGVYWISTVRQDGQPNVTSIAGVVHDGGFYFCTGPGEQKALNLARNPRCAITAGNSSFKHGVDIVIEGEVSRVTDQALLESLASSYEQKYEGFFGFSVGHEAFETPGQGVALVYRVVADKGFAFAKGEPFSQTRWRFGPHT